MLNRFAGFGFDGHLLSNNRGRADARVDIFVPEALLEDRKRRLTRAVRGRYETDLGVVVKKGRDGFDLITLAGSK